ncbi:MAG: phosphate/phosphite/phosphonate ABC transporter substrate-binding protein [Thermodesulfovibrionales bacterium]|nr:phosphate/phosphite/phosphonate ABC transporter substrate-binding protein [Thermodesulfovibrionales bacterium]
MKKRSVLSFIAVAILFAAAVFILFRWNDRQVLKVDFKDVSPGNNIAKELQEQEQPVLRIAIGAMISPRLTLRYYEDLLKVVTGKLGMKPVFIQRKTYAEVNQLLKDRQVDVAFVCSGPYVRGKQDFGMELLVVPVVNGKTVYYSYLIVHKDSSFKNLNDLRGKKFAFTDPDSNTGKLIPTYILAKMGERPESFFRETFFTYSHDNSIQAVAEKLADGATVNSLIWDFFDKNDPRHTSQTRILEKSPPYGIPPIVVNPSLDPALKQRLREIFLYLHEDQATAALLKKMNIDRFETGEDGLYDSIRELEKWLGKNNSRKQ